MATGAVPLLEAAKWGDDLLKKGVVETIVRESPLLETLPWVTIQGNALKHMVEDTLPDMEFRDVGGTYTQDHGTDVEHYWGTAILGGEVFVDNYIVRTRGNLGDVKARQYQKKAKANALTFDKTFFDGTGTAKDFKGVNKLIDEDFGQKLAVATNGLQLNSSTNLATFLDKLDEAHDLLRTGTADAILLNRTIRRLITKAARTSVSGVSLIDIGDDAFGRQVMQWNGIGLRIIGDDRTGAQILDFDETEGSSTDCASLYFVRYGADEFVSGLMGAGGSFEVVDFGEVQAKPGHMGRIEWYPGLTTENHSFKVRDALAGKEEFDLVKPEDLAGVALDKVEEKAREIQAERQKAQGDLLRDVLKRQGFDGDELDEMVQAMVARKTAESEEAEALNRARSIGQLPAKPVPPINPDKLHEIDAIKAGIEQNARKKRRSA